MLLAASLIGARRAKAPDGSKDWLKIAHRLAAGLTPHAAALPEGGDERLVDRLLAQEGFQAVVDAAVARLAEPPETHRKRLVGLARQALERALLNTDRGVILFVLEEDTRDRDPAASLADSVLRAQARALRPPAPLPSPTVPPVHTGGYAPGYHPLRAMMQRGVARMCQAVQTEDVIRHAAAAAAEEAPPNPQAEAARRAWALRQAVATAAREASQPVEPSPDTSDHRPAADAPTPIHRGAEPRGPP